MMNSAQLSLFEPVLNAYKEAGELTNEQLYGRLSEKLGLPKEVWAARQPVGRSGELHNLQRRSVRWVQQTLKAMGLLERSDARAVWRTTPKAKGLTPAPPRTFLVAFSTDLGIALWGRCQDVFQRIDEPLHLVLTSPPYPLQRPRAYGNPPVQEYVDFICNAMEPLVRHLVPGGSVCLNLGNDVFEPGTPARSLYSEMVVVAMHTRLGLALMDRLVWQNFSKAPGPTMWASRTRQQLNVAWEPVFWFTNDPKACRSDNRRVLQPHTERHTKLMARGGERRNATFGDGANRIREGSFGEMTPGRIPRNVIAVGHRCRSQDEMRALARAEGLPVHSASMPLKLARFLVEFLSEPNDLVVDNFAGWFTTAAACEETGRRWIGSELMAEHARGGSLRSQFRQASGFQCSI
ncbi:site-specific DNA-methyltransferase [Ramlibacter sp. AN1133]|uniref:site-specific DNA-methyltransferase n=1 Tax=Ramlibacter sp. AN1133 TaxID=3133429 RepID=UPI0030BB1F25